MALPTERERESQNSLSPSLGHVFFRLRSLGFSQKPRGRGNFIPILPKRKLRSKGVKFLAQSHVSSKSRDEIPTQVYLNVHVLAEGKAEKGSKILRWQKVWKSLVGLFATSADSWRKTDAWRWCLDTWIQPCLKPVQHSFVSAT